MNSFSTAEVCQIPMDTTFVIDTSMCDDLGNWNRMKKFVQTLVTFCDVSPAMGRVSLVIFSTDANVILKFNSLTGNLLSSEEVNKRVNALQCEKGTRRIDKALDVVDKQVLTQENGMRDVSRVNIITRLKL